MINLGVEGYGTDQELLRLEREGARYQPDIVILNFCLTNDALNNVFPTDLEQLRPKPYFSLEAGQLKRHAGHLKLSPLRRIGQWLVEESHLYRHLTAVLPGLKPREEGPAPNFPGVARLRGPAASELTFRLVREVEASARQAGARFY